MSALHAWPDQETAAFGEKLGFTRRKHARRDAPHLALAIGNGVYSAKNWSLGGALIEAYDGVLQVGDTFEITSMMLHERRWPVMIQSRVVRLGDYNNDLAVQFTVLDRLAFDMMEAALLRRPNGASPRSVTA